MRRRKSPAKAIHSLQLALTLIPHLKDVKKFPSFLCVPERIFAVSGIFSLLFSTTAQDLLAYIIFMTVRCRFRLNKVLALIIWDISNIAERNSV